MPFFKQLKESNSLRLFFFGIGIIAVLVLTGMNVYSLYALRTSTIEAAKENKKTQLDEFTNQIRYRFDSPPFRELVRIDLQESHNMWEQTGTFPHQFNNVILTAARDSIFEDVYYLPGDSEACHQPENPVYKLDLNASRFLVAPDPPRTVCDGFSISKSRVAVLIDDYRWNNKRTFDAHRSMTVALIDTDNRSVIGHLNFVINRDYLIHGLLEPRIKAQFSPSEDSGLIVWMRDYIQNEVILSSDENYSLSRDKVDLRQRFPEMLDNWTLHASFLESPTMVASNASLTRNLIVLLFAVFVLFGAMVFMFINAQRERELAQRQAGFLANITHELKTPLAVMQAAGENISDGRVTDGNRLKGYGDHIYNESVRLRKMIEKLLDVAKIDSGQTVIQQSPHQAENLVKDYYNSNRSYVEDRGFKFSLEISDSLPLIMVDPSHMETILSNLVGNSVKYSSDQKEIRIVVEHDGNSVKISVIDKGDGIPKKAIKSIFNKFYRVESPLTAKTKGHGLGLAIVKNMVEINGGKVSVNSEPGRGSEFTVSFPGMYPGRAENVVSKSAAPENINPTVQLETDTYVK